MIYVMDKIEESAIRITGRLESSRTRVTTFRVTRESVDAMEWLCSRYEISMKDLYNQILGDEFFLTTIAGIVGDKAVPKNSPIVKKTQRIANSTLDRLNLFSKKYGVSRDDLVQTSFLLLKETEINQIEAKRDVHSKALKEINKHIKVSEIMKDKLHDIVGRKDTIYDRFDLIIAMLKNLSKDINLELKEAVPISSEQP
jgi:hypothetical protein|tara:strand:+ start:818 stop:1414 length:597 start_codon:yes stop_codon:yes gene_type:complete